MFTNPIVLNLFFTQNSWVPIIRWLLQILYPPFNFSLVFNAIAEGTAPMVNEVTNQIESPGRFQWQDLYEEMRPTGFSVTIPPAHEGLLFLLMQIIIYGALALYTDQVISGPNVCDLECFLSLLLLNF